MENKETKVIVGYKDIPTILMVDDDPDIIEFVNQSLRIFSETRYRVVFATTGEGAISIVNIQPIDAVVLDIKLPDVTGINIGKQIKEHYPDMPVAIFTSYSGDNVEEQVREIGASYWYKLEKMANPELLLSNLNNLVNHIDQTGTDELSEFQLEDMRDRRKARIDKLKFPSFLITTQVKTLL